MKVEIFAHLDLPEKDMIELDDDMSEKEIDKAVYDYVAEFLDLGYKIIEDEDK